MSRMSHEAGLMFFGRAKKQPRCAQMSECVLSTLGKKWPHSMGVNGIPTWTRWWFEIFSISIPIWGWLPFWLIFSKLGSNHQLDEAFGYLLMFRFCVSEASSIIQIQICAYVGAVPEFQKENSETPWEVWRMMLLREKPSLLPSLYRFERYLGEAENQFL